MDFYGTKVNGKPVYESAVQEQMRTEWNKIQEGAVFKKSIVVPRDTKSYSQVKLIWGNMIANTIIQAYDKDIGYSELLGYLIAHDLPKGTVIDKDFLHQLMYVICPTTDENGKKITLSKMDTLQASSLFKRYCNIMAGVGIHIEEPPSLPTQDNTDIGD